MENHLIHIFVENFSNVRDSFIWASSSERFKKIYKKYSSNFNSTNFAISMSTAANARGWQDANKIQRVTPFFRLNETPTTTSTFLIWYVSLTCIYFSKNK